jgi:hypothetical protein
MPAAPLPGWGSNGAADGWAAQADLTKDQRTVCLRFDAVPGWYLRSRHRPGTLTPLAQVWLISLAAPGTIQSAPLLAHAK